MTIRKSTNKRRFTSIMGNTERLTVCLSKLFPPTEENLKHNELFSFFAESYLQTKSYYLAAYQFENFIKSYPKSDRIQEASFKAAKSYYNLSPIYSLDQEDTYTAIEKLQVFLNLYPNSEFAEEANQMISELQEKLEQKEFEIAKQYNTIRDHKAAIKANENFIAGFPGTKFREESLYIKFLSSFEIATNSIFSKKQERLEDLQQQYQLILRYYPETLFLEDLNKKMEVVNATLEELNTTTTLSK